jgi:hypothetical protein
MPQLGDYIGMLLSEVTIARMQADIETVRLSELYSSHPLLKNFPIPRFRLPNIEMDIPVVIKKMEESSTGELPRGTPTLPELRKSYDELLINTLKEREITLKPEMLSKLKVELDKKMSLLSKPREICFDVKRIADEFTNSTFEILSEFGISKDLLSSKLESNIRESVQLEFLNLRKPVNRLNVLINTSEIKEAGPNDIITQIHLKITEEAYELTSIESSEGIKMTKFVME